MYGALNLGVRVWSQKLGVIVAEKRMSTLTRLVAEKMVVGVIALKEFWLEDLEE